MAGPSILILTFNEEMMLPRCMASIAWCDDVVVLDSYSTDATADVARAHGVRVIQRSFDDYAAQRNFGINEIDHKYPWLFLLDADEEVPDQLYREMQIVLSAVEPDVGLFRVRRKDFWGEKWLRHSTGYPTWSGRLVRVGAVHIARAVHEQCTTTGDVRYLRSHFHHHPFARGVHHWFDRHNQYSTLEAALISNSASGAARLRDVFHGDPVVRRRAVKRLAYRLPFRPLWVFLGLYVLRRGWLDGRAGLSVCLLRSFYEFMINCKVRELRRRR